MKAVQSLLAALLVVGAASSQVLAEELSQNQTTTWQGSGDELTPAGEELSHYTFVTTNTVLTSGEVQSVTVITPLKGDQKTITQTLKINGKKFSIVSNLGQGGGACYGDGICESYIRADEEGKAYATTLFEDSTGSRHNLTVVLKDGKAVKMLRDKMSLAK